MLLPMMLSSLGLLILSTLLCCRAMADNFTQLRMATNHASARKRSPLNTRGNP